MSKKRNLIDYYQLWENDAIKADLDKKRHPFSVLCTNLNSDFNIAGVIRNANAFLAKQIYVYGNRKYDRRGTVGTYHYEHISFFKRSDSLEQVISEHTLTAVDNVDGASPIDDFIWPENTLMAFGQEQIGLPDEILEKAKHTIYIKQFGSVRSLNVASASAICMYDWCKKHGSI